MAEDSGAFKTNSRISAGFQQFVITLGTPLQPSLTGKEMFSGRRPGIRAADF
jgi:hypothetical protein